MLGGMEFVFVAIGVSIIVRSVAAVRGTRSRELPHYPAAQQPARLEDPRVSALQTEVEELRTQVERLSAAETFYAQLNAPAPGGAGASGGAVPPGTSAGAGGGERAGG